MSGPSGNTLTARQLKFCLAIVEGNTNAKAYAKAGYKCNSRQVTEVNASRLLKSAKVQAKIAELRLPATRKAGITLEWLTEEARQNIEFARHCEQPAAVTGALALLAKLHGHITEHKTVDIVHHKPAKQPVLKDLELSEDEWLRLYKPHE
jgi:hypothetical protein